MPTIEEPILDDDKQLAVRAEQQLAVRTEIAVVTAAIEASLGVRELTTEFYARRTALIAAGDKFTKPPEDDDEQEKALTAQRNLASLRIEVTKQSDAWKGPLNAARKRIIELTDSGLAAIEKEEQRIAGLINARQQKLAAARREAEEAAERERKKIADAAAAAQRAQEDAERKRREAELAEINAKLAKGKAALKLQEEAKRLAAEATKSEEDAFEKQLAAESAPEPVVEPVSDAPMAKEHFDFIVKGENITQKKANAIELLRAHSELFTFKLDEDNRGCALTLKIRDLVERLNSQPPFQPIKSAPGIEIHKTLTKLR